MLQFSHEKDLLDGESSLTDHLSSTTRRQKTDILLVQALGQIQQSSLVVDGDNSCIIISIEPNLDPQSGE